MVEEEEGVVVLLVLLAAASVLVLSRDDGVSVRATGSSKKCRQKIKKAQYVELINMHQWYRLAVIA